jgi:alpha-tubulin suppressor-like RCC1 family protein
MQVPLGASAAAFATKSYHVCAALADRTARCWGMNDGGQIGDGLGGNRLGPATVAGLADVVEVGVGRSFSCARLSTGDVTCWGANTAGQLGDNSMTPETTPSTTVQGLTAQPLAIFVGASHACALLPGGTGMCWGSNLYRQLGDGTTTDHPTAIAMPLANLVQIAPSGYSVTPFVGGATCVLRTDKTVWCWGSNDFGQLGTGATSATPTSTPAKAANLTDAVELVAGRYHACARRANGAVACWGRNDFGQVGDGTYSVRAAPVDVPLPRPAIHLGAGGFHSCALLDDYSIRCWGNNGYGQLGDGSQSTSATPVASQMLCQ